nr:hypothetical protein TetV2_00457 [Oceanusvirus sp.]
MTSGRPNARQLQAEAKIRRKAKKRIFETILEKIYQRIELKASLDWTRLVYEVPPFVVGVPPYDVVECGEYLRRALKKDGYIVEIYGGTVLYVSWDGSEEISKETSI